MGNVKFYSSILWLWVQEKPSQAMELNGTYPISVWKYLEELYRILKSDSSDKEVFEAEMEEAQRVLSISFEDQQYQEMIASLLNND